MQESLIKALTHCTRCPDMCACTCPVYTTTKKQSVSPSNLAHTARMLLTEVLPADTNVIDTLYQCNGCYLCTTLCIYDDLVLPELLIQARTEAVSRFGETLLPERVRAVKENHAQPGMAYPDPFGEPIPIIHSELQELVSERGNILFFGGCMINRHQPEIAQSVLQTLSRNGIDYVYSPAQEPCCGAPLIELGFLSEGKTATQKTLDYIEQSGCELVLTACPRCTYQLTEGLKHLELSHDIRVLHITEYLAAMLSEGSVSFKNTLNKTVQVDRDPHLVSLPRLETALDQILSFVPNLNQCQATVTSYNVLPNPETEITITNKSLNKALASKVEMIITTSPLAKHSLQKLQPADIRIADITEILVEIQD